MKKALAIIGIVTLLSMVFSLPVAAASPDRANGPPETMDLTLPFTENISGVQVTICGGTASGANPFSAASGTFIAHILKPASATALEESWFEVTSFTGWVILSVPPAFPPPPAAVIAAHYYSFDGRIKVMVHNGTQTNQPIISIRSSEPVYVPFLNAEYSNIQMLGWGNIIRAS